MVGNESSCFGHLVVLSQLFVRTVQKVSILKEFPKMKRFVILEQHISKLLLFFLPPKKCLFKRISQNEKFGNIGTAHFKTVVVFFTPRI